MEIQLSIILPTFNEIKLGILPKLLEAFEGINSFEMILVDRMSDDGTVEFIKSHPLFQTNTNKLKLIKTISNGRGKRLQEGFQISQGRIILLHHPRSILTKEGIQTLIQSEGQWFWGGFTHKFDWPSPLLEFTSWYSNNIRADFRKIFYLDHCIFASRDLLLQTEIPDVEIFEDTILSERLANLCKPIRLSNASTTSSIRFKKNGILYQCILNQCMKWGFYLGIPLHRLNAFYEKSLELNSKYREGFQRDRK